MFLPKYFSDLLFLFSRLILLAFSLCCPPPLLAQSTINIKQLDVDNGLSNNHIISVCQDSYGYLWIGTQHGLNKYDSYSFDKFYYDPGVENTLSGNAVMELYEDTFKNLWIGTESGICLYNQETNDFRQISIYNKYGYVFNVDVYEIFETADDELVVLSNENLFIFNSADGFDRSNRFLSTQDNTYSVKGGRSIVEDKNNMLWIATEGNGLKLFDKKNRIFVSKSKNYQILNHVNDLYLNKIYYDKKNDEIYICSRNSGVYKCSDYTSLPIKYINGSNSNEELSDNTVFDLYIDSRNIAWIATASGIDKLLPPSGELKRFNTLSQNSALSSDEVRVIFEDKLGNMWFGTARSGINILRNSSFNNNFKVYQHNPLVPSSLSNDPVLSILQDEDENLWVGTDWGGINIFNNKGQVFKRLKHNPKGNSIGSNAITSLFQDENGKIWVGCYRGGLQVVNPKTFWVEKNYFSGNYQHEISHNSISHIYQDHSGRIWVATSGGGVHLYNETSDSFNAFKSNDTWDGSHISTNFITQTYDNNDGYIWFATYYGLNRYDPVKNEFKYFFSDANDSTSISHNWIYSLCTDDNGDLWVGTANGLNKYNIANNDFTIFKEKDGLIDDIVTGIVNDGSGYLWISTANGISRLNPKTYHFGFFWVNGKSSANEFVHGAYYKSPEGEIFFGGSKGFVRIFPDSIKRNNTPPLKVTYTDIQLFNLSVPVGKESIISRHISLLDTIELNYKHSVVSFEYAVLGQVDADRLFYQYKLEGFNENWVNAGTNRLITYTNLKPGNYQLKVRATYANKTQNEPPTTLFIKVKPAPWNTVYARLIYLALFVSILYLLRKYSLISIVRKNQLQIEQINRENSEKLTQSKLQFFTNIAHEIRTPLTLILGPLNRNEGVIEKDDIILMKRHANKLLKLVNQILDFRKVSSGKMPLLIYRENIPRLLQEISDSFKNEAIQKNISISVDSEFDTYFTYTDPDKLNKICSNLISNALNHNKHGGSVHIRFSVSKKPDASIELFPDGFYTLEIADTGVGIPVEEQKSVFDRFYTVKQNLSGNSTGIGLAIAKEFVEILNGKIELESYLGKGSVFRVILPLIQRNTEEIIDKNRNQEHFYKIVSEADDYEFSNKKSGKDLVIENYASGAKKILIIDDHQDMRSYLRDIFKPNYKIITEENGQKGLESVLMHYPDLIIADIMMPGMDGLEFCSRIKKDTKLSHIPIILVTAISQIDVKIKGLELGADDYIEKPFDERVLKLKVEKAFKNREALSSGYNKGINPGNDLIQCNTTENLFMDKVISIINLNISNPLFGINDIIAEVGMSRSVFYRKIKAVTNRSVVDLIHSVKLQKAADILKSNDMQIADVAIETGFNDTSYFIKLFKETYGITPGDYK